MEYRGMNVAIYIRVQVKYKIANQKVTTLYYCIS